MLMFFSSVEVTPLSAETIFKLGPLAITNSMLFGVITALAVVLLLVIASRRSQLYPRVRLAYYLELIVDFIFNIAQESFGSREKAMKHLPLLVTLFTFIFISNLSGLLPGVGTVTTQGRDGPIPLLRPFTTDLNATLAMAILTIGLVQFYAIRELGLGGHFKHYFSERPWRPINLFIGFNEVFGELLRIVTLSMRLFGVIYAGEVLIGAIGQLAGNFAWLATLPAVMLEIFFSAVQAYIFMMLTTTYLSIATAGGEEHKRVEAQAEAVS